MIRFALAAAPASEPVTRDEAKAHARIEHDFEDALVDAFITAARLRVEADTLRALVTQTWTATLDRWNDHVAGDEWEGWPFVQSPTPRRVRLARPPIASITSLVVDGTTIASANYALRHGNELWIKSDVADSEAELGAGIVITYVAGQAAADVPADLKLAVKLMFAHFYAVRETTSPQGIYHQVAPHGYEALIAPHRVLEI